LAEALADSLPSIAMRHCPVGGGSVFTRSLMPAVKAVISLHGNTTESDRIYSQEVPVADQDLTGLSR
jgi:hypothetical protein